MKALLICPSERSAVGQLSAAAPLAAVPLLGACLLEYWLSHLAAAGVSRVLVLAHDRPECVRAVVGDGARWGLSVEVVAESRELTPAQAMLKYAEDLQPSGAAGTPTVLDHLPLLPEHPLFGSYADLFAGLRQWVPRAITPDRVGMREAEAGIWLSTHAQVSPRAKLRAPCWVGEGTFVGEGAMLGPNALVENGAFLEPGAEVVESWVGPDTLVGSLARLDNSVALGSTLIHWPSGSTAEVPDPFLLSALRQPRTLRAGGWLARAAALYARNKEEVLLLWKELLLHKEGP